MTARARLVRNHRTGQTARRWISFCLLAAALPAVGRGAVIAAPAYRVVRADTLGGDGSWDCLTYDGAGHRLFIARQNRVMVVNTETGKLAAEIPGLDRAHAVAVDYASGRGFATSGGDSSVVMFDLKTLNVLGRIPADKDADIALDESTHRIFTVTAGFGPMPAATPEHPHPRPTLLPGTFTLLVLEPAK